MPLQWAHEFYWPGDGVVNPIEERPPAQYPAWQGVVCGLLLVAVPAGLAIAVAAGWAVWRALTTWVASPSGQQRLAAWSRAYVPDRLWATWRVWRLLGGPAFQQATAAVASVAVTRGMREPEMWGAIGRRLGRIPGHGENLFRHLLAVERMGAVPHRQRHTQNVALELAYWIRRERR